MGQLTWRGGKGGEGGKGREGKGVKGKGGSTYTSVQRTHGIVSFFIYFLNPSCPNPLRELGGWNLWGRG